MEPDGDLPERPYYICSKKDCETHEIVFWDELGDSYFLKDYHETLEKYPDRLIPIDSLKMKQSIEIEKHDEDFVLLNLRLIKAEIHYTYKSDYFGRILERTAHVQIYTRYGRSWRQYNSQISMYLYMIQSFKDYLALYVKNPENEYAQKKMMRLFNMEDSCLYKKAAKLWINCKYSNIKKQIILSKLFS